MYIAVMLVVSILLHTSKSLTSLSLYKHFRHFTTFKHCSSSIGSINSNSVSRLSAKKGIVVGDSDDVLTDEEAQVEVEHDDDDDDIDDDDDGDCEGDDGRIEDSTVKPGHVYYIATPLGNIGDMTIRSIEILKNVDIIAAEDTRQTRKLLKLLKIPNKKSRLIISHNEHNWNLQIPKLLDYIGKQSYSVAVVSDAGTPGISDPGAELARSIHQNNIPIHPIPGPSAVVSALSICGFPATEFTFLGFLPVKGKERKEKLSKLTLSSLHNIVLFEAPHRIKETIDDIAAILNENNINRQICCCRELTKLHEEIKRGSIDDIKQWLGGVDGNKSRGEFTVVLSSIITDTSSSKLESLEDTAHKQLDILREDGVARSEAVRLVADMLKNKMASKSFVYKIALSFDQW